ncbi:MAG: ATP-dependent helicase [Salinivenus sp.]
MTETQQAIIAHGDGPAAVVAGPGTGKTTVLAHRVRRLLQKHDVPPPSILVCSFGRDTVDDLQTALHRLDITGVTTCTLHALGRRILQAAEHPACTPPDTNSDRSPASQARALARLARSERAADRNVDPADLGYSTSDLVDRISAWKQNLIYVPDAWAALPPAAQETARPCDDEEDELVALFRAFEKHRRSRNWLTYADMVRSGWEHLATDPSLRETIQSRYRYVLVDEFQDLSRAQVCLLDLLTASHRNYMVVGDEDQCIYGWRGADPSHLLTFRDRYDAPEYRMTQSFRLPASALVLANAVIEQNDERRATRLRCTQGLSGSTRVITPPDHGAEATEIANRIEALRADGLALDDMAVLVRTFGQTPPLERVFLERDLPHRLTGAAPFYKRAPVRTLLQYLYWAHLERQRRRHGWFSSDRTADQYVDRFARILKRPTRYVPHNRIRRIARTARRRHTSVLDRLRSHRSSLPEETAEQVDAFLEIAESLVRRLDAPARPVLEWLVETLEYRSHLRDTSALTHLAEARVQTVQTFLRYAGRHETPIDLLSDIRTLAQQQPVADDGSALDLRSIHRAKGQEWPVVFVPGCVHGTLPLTTENNSFSLEEERRVLYVAVTRPKTHLVLSCPTTGQRSPFLAEADAETQLRTVRAVRTALTTEPEALTERDLVRLCQGIIESNLISYIRSWWTPQPQHRSALRGRLNQMSASIATAERREQAYRQAHAEWAAGRRRAIENMRDRLRSARDRIGAGPIGATTEESTLTPPPDALLSFERTDAEEGVVLRWNGERVGALVPLGPHRLDAPTVLSLPWDVLVGRVDRARPRRNRLSFRIEWTPTIEELDHRMDAPNPPPEPPSNQLRALLEDAFQRGYTALRDVLSPERPQHQERLDARCG